MCSECIIRMSVFGPGQLISVNHSGIYICGWADWLDREKLSEEMTTESLREHVACQQCGSRDGGIWIVCVGAGEYGYR